MKIIVVGGGIAGLSAYHALRKHLPDAQIQLYESHDSPKSPKSTIGGGLGLAPNGLRTIDKIAPDSLAYIQSRGRSGGIMTFRNSKGALLGRFWSGRKERYGFSQVVCPRAVVHEGLLLGIPDEAIKTNRVSAVREADGVDGVEVQFADGTAETADFVFGADGVKSVVREGLLGAACRAVYDGFTGIGGFVPFASLPQRLQAGLESDPLTMTFGPRGFFGFGLADGETPPRQVMWWSTYETPDPPSRDSPMSAIQSQLLERHAAWASEYDSPDAPVFQTLITEGCASKNRGAETPAADVTVAQADILVLPRYICPDLPSWSSSSGRIILIGDAAHAMPTDAGQGVACAVEDVFCVASLLKYYSVDQRFDIGEVAKRTARSYEAIRMKRVKMISDMAKRRGNNKKMQTWWQECIRDWMLWLLCKLPESLNDRVMAYDIEKEVEKFIRSQSS